MNFDDMFLADLRRHFEDKYGKCWERDDLDLEEQIAWISKCYDFYEMECERKDVYGGLYTDKSKKCYGKPFEIVRRVQPNEEGYDLISLPSWIIKITDPDMAPEDDPGEFAAYPEELFHDGA